MYYKYDNLTNSRFVKNGKGLLAGFIVNSHTDGTLKIEDRGADYKSPLTVKGGVVRVIDSATGDIARTTNGWIEDEKYGTSVKMFVTTSPSAEFDTAVLIDGSKSVKLSGVAIKERVNADIWPNTYPDIGPGSPSQITKYLSPVVGATVYRFKVKLKSTISNVFGTPTGVKISILEHSDTVLTKSNHTVVGIVSVADITEYTVDFTTHANSKYVNICIGLYGDATNYFDGILWFGRNSMTLTPVSSITNSGSTPALYYPKLTAASSTNNIDQSNTSTTTSSGTVRKIAQSFVPTKKNLTGIVFRKGTTTITGDVTVSIQNDTAGSPSGSAIVSSAILNATFNAINGSYTVNLSSTLTVGSTYWIVISLDSGTNQQTNITREADGTGGTAKYDASGSWTVWNLDIYHQTLYSKNTTNLTVSTATQTVSVTAPTTDGWADGTVIDTAGGLYDVTPLTLYPGQNDIYVSSNGPATADGTVDPSLQMTIGTGLSTTLVNTFTIPTGSKVYKLKRPIAFNNGLYVTIGGVADVTMIYS